MSARVCRLVVLAVAFATPAAAQSFFQTGETVIANPGFADAACVDQAELERYSSAREICQMGRREECQVTQELEGRGACGFHYGVYVVTSVNAQLGLIQISPQSDRSLSYWAEADDFKPAE
ncbi:MAG TPA: hypothetical protein VHZ26_04060 [Caulobacteraceae bacterium]|jgi:hypothetical protein|nr:hypothetical protein [Caulobacteraceae bacterium]